MVGEMKPTLDNPGTGHLFVCNADKSVWIISSRAWWYYSLSSCFYPPVRHPEASFTRELWWAYLSWNYEELASAPPNFGLMS
jgi:hypothetical protein